VDPWNPDIGFLLDLDPGPDSLPGFLQKNWKFLNFLNEKFSFLFKGAILTFLDLTSRLAFLTPGVEYSSRYHYHGHVR
jgi:hypothetical protein